MVQTRRCLLKKRRIIGLSMFLHSPVEKKDRFCQLLSELGCRSLRRMTLDMRSGSINLWFLVTHRAFFNAVDMGQPSKYERRIPHFTPQNKTTRKACIHWAEWTCSQGNLRYYFLEKWGKRSAQIAIKKSLNNGHCLIWWLSWIFTKSN